MTPGRGALGLTRSQRSPYTFEDGDRPVAGDEGWSHEPDTGVGHGAIVPPEVVRAQKEPDAATRLVFDERLLLWPRRPANLDSMSHPELR